MQNAGAAKTILTLHPNDNVHVTSLNLNRTFHVPGLWAAWLKQTILSQVPPAHIEVAVVPGHRYTIHADGVCIELHTDTIWIDGKVPSVEEVEGAFQAIVRAAA